VTSQEAEIEQLKKVYADIMFALDEIEPFLAKEELNRRRYYLLLSTLKSYLDLYQKDAVEDSNRGFFGKLVNKDSIYDEQLREFRRTNADKLSKLNLCSRCQCLKCLKICAMEGCNRCDPKAYLIDCDNATKSVYFVEGKSLPLTDDRGVDAIYTVLAYIVDKEYNQFYIVTEVNGEKKIFYLYPSTNGDTYGNITDADDFNFAVRAFEEASSMAT